jgi:RNA polymerase sigma factor (sigma-70 family)
VASVEARIHQVARWYANPHCPEEDLCQEGRLGAVLGFRKYDPARGIAYATFADYWIRLYIRRGYQNYRGLIRLPLWRQTSDQARRLPELCEATKVVSLSGIAEDEEALPLTSATRQTDRLPIDERLALSTACARLPAGEREVLTLRYREEWSQDEVAARMGRSRARIGQIEAQALARLRQLLGDDGSGSPSSKNPPPRVL